MKLTCTVCGRDAPSMVWRTQATVTPVTSRTITCECGNSTFSGTVDNVTQQKETPLTVEALLRILRKEWVQTSPPGRFASDFADASHMIDLDALIAELEALLK